MHRITILEGDRAFRLVSARLNCTTKDIAARPSHREHDHRISVDPRGAGNTDKPAGPVLRHDAESQLARITAPTLVTFGRFDLLTSTRFAEMLTAAIKDAELHIFEDCAHTPIYQNVEALNQRTLAFVDQHAG